MAWWRRLRGTMQIDRVNEELDEEAQFHIEGRTEQYIREGLSPDEARRQAIRRFGNPARLREETRDWNILTWLHSVGQDVRFSVRSLRGTPGFVAASVTTLAVGIGAATAIGTAAHQAFLRPLPYPYGDRLVVLGHPTDTGAVGNVGFETVADWRTRLKQFDELAIIRGWTPTLVTDNGATQVQGMRVNWNYFRMLGVRPAQGRDFEPTDDRPDQWRVLIISDALWRDQLGARPDVVGSSLNLFGRPYQVIGVMPASYEPIVSAHFFQRADVWAPLGYAIGGDSSCRSCRHLKLLGRLSPGAALPSAMAELATVQEGIRREHPNDYTAAAPVGLSVRDELARPIRRPLQVLLVAVVFVLLVASANVAGLVLARSVARDREFALRAALGAGWGRIARQLLTESLVLASVGGILGWLVARGGVAWLATSAPLGLPRIDRAATDPALVVTALAATGLALIIFGLVPTLFAARAKLETVLRTTRQSGSSRATTIREWLTAGQIAIALLLVAAAGLMYRTVEQLMRVDPGFNPRHVLSLNLSLVGPAWAQNTAVRAFQDELLERVKALPGVESAALSGQIPLGGNYDQTGFHIEGRPDASGPDAPALERYSVTPDYFRTMGITLKEGRLIAESDINGADPIVLVNETAARTLWHGASPIGARARIGDNTGPFHTVVGVVNDVHHFDLSEPPTTQMYFPQRQRTDSFLVLVVRTTTDPAAFAAPIRVLVASLAKDVPVFDVATLDERVSRSVASRTFLMQLLGLFAAATVLLSVVGLYAVVSHSVATRRREFGVRLALGAARQDIWWLVLRRGFTLVFCGLAAGLGGSFLLGRLLASQLFQTPSVDPVTLVGSAAVLLGVSLVAHFGPIRRALRVDPALALRSE